MTLLILQKQSETRVIGIFNNISIDVSECNDIGEIIETFKLGYSDSDSSKIIRYFIGCYYIETMMLFIGLIVFIVNFIFIVRFTHY